MKKLLFLTIGLSMSVMLAAQTNLRLSSDEIRSVLLGEYNPEDYLASNPIEDPKMIDSLMVRLLSPDSLRIYLEELQVFENRNTGSDTISDTRGIGASQRWCMTKFDEISQRRENRLLTGFFQYDQMTCGMGRHKNVLAVLPGSGSHFNESVLIEAHLDSRCEDACDVDCLAEGMEDNGSGSVLVIELARILSKYQFDRTIIFMLTTGEEQGLQGARAFGQYIVNNDIKLKAILNNDVIGGIICGETASPPACPGLNHIDSINVRIFSAGSINSSSKGLARYTKLQFEEMSRPHMSVKPNIRLMTPEDRTGRGGDHIPFRELGFPAIRFTSANEHGDANSSDSDYHDRQHSIRDILGVDTDNDGELDSFFVDFNYLARNAIINGSSLISLTQAPSSPYFLEIDDFPGGFIVEFQDSMDFDNYRIAVRMFDSNDWDTLYHTSQKRDTILGLPHDIYYAVSAMSVNENGVESLVSNEEWGSFPTGLEDVYSMREGIRLLQNRPNPFDEATIIGVHVEQAPKNRDGAILFRDLNGRQIANLPIRLNPGLQEVIYDYHNHEFVPGTYSYSLVVDGQTIDTKRMIYAY